MKRLTRLALIGLLPGLLSACAPALGGLGQRLLSAQATVQAGQLAFQMENISGRLLLVQDGYCPASELMWDITSAGGQAVTSAAAPPEACPFLLTMRPLVPGESLILKRPLNLPPGTYTVRAWVKPAEPQLPGDGRLEAQPITVTIP
ncbi:hypothetical protein [Deinococcus sp.]|uniref:hypothetical protein n=1 Tax=Deinococcus sp. TaxID=47478 RepID=UPI003B59A822